VSSRAAGIGFLGFVWRALFAMVLVLATYNPAQISYYHWVRGAIGAGNFGALHATGSGARSGPETSVPCTP
jgi:hypothetical protein